MKGMARSRVALPWLLLLLAGLAAAWLRYGLIEPSVMTERCSGAYGPAWCYWRQWLVLGFQHHAYGVTVYGVVALAATALALLWKRTWVAWLAAALGAFALELYCFEAGALALLVGCLCLLRMQARVLTGPTPIEQNRRRDRQVQSQP
jgi:hypothetical protein